MKVTDIWQRFSRFMKNKVTIHINSDWVEMVKQGESEVINHSYQVLGGEVSTLLGEKNSLPEDSELQSMFVSGDDWIKICKMLSHRKVVERINEELGQKITNMQYLRTDLQSYSGIIWHVSFEDYEYNPVPITASEMKELLNKEIGRAEKMKKELIHYANLSSKALNCYISTVSKQFSPLFTEQGCQKLIEYIQKYDALGEKSDSYGLENIAEIRKRLGMSENDELNKLLLTRKAEREKRGVQERLKEIHGEEPNSGEQKETEKRWVPPKTRGTFLPIRCR